MNPIDRAAQALADDWNPDRDPILTAMFRDYAITALSSINTGGIARIIHPGYGRPRHDLPKEQPCLACKRAHHIARAVKAWLTGKDNQ